MKNNTPVKLAFISFEHPHAWSYAEAARELPEIEVVGLFDSDDRRLRKAQEMFPWARTTRIATELFQLPELDACVICSCNSMHEKHLELAANASVHVLCEKPISTSLGSARRMIQLAQQAGILFQICFPCRYAPAALRAKQIISQGTLGEIESVKTTNRGSMPGGWFVEAALSGGGAVMDHTVHVVDLLRWILGKEVTQVYAEIGSRIHNLPCDDIGLISFQMGDKLFGTLDPSWSRLPGYPIWGDVTLEFLGTGGRLAINVFPQAAHLFLTEGRTHQAISPANHPDLEMLKDFAQAVRDKRAPSITGLDGLRALEVAIAAYRSAEENQPVSLPLIKL